MNIYLIYSHHNRRMAIEVGENLTKDGHETFLAPLGLAVGSDPWKKRVEEDVRQSDLVLVLLTTESVVSESVDVRIQIALDAHKPVMPLMVEDCEPPLILRNYQYMPVEDPEEGINYPRLLAAVQMFRPPTMCFISYTRDDKEFVDRLVRDLQQRQVSTWRDVDNITAGASWAGEIEKALKRATHLLFVASQKSIQSPNVADEISFALKSKTTIIPLMVEDCDLPLRVHRAEWIDFRQDYQEALNKLLKAINM